MRSSARELEWARWMKSAIAGDRHAYHKLLTAITPHLRAVAKRRCDRLGVSPSEVEDVVQETLLAIHLKRGTWDSARPLGPWMSALVGNKLIDSLRRRGHRADVPLEDVMETLGSGENSDASDRMDIERVLSILNDRQRSIVRSISIEGSSVSEVAEGLKMTEVAVRVSLHRAMKSLSALHAKQPK
jgi:RNA polymerase sigma-70 factor (ECF subfamily)